MNDIDKQRIRYTIEIEVPVLKGLDGVIAEAIKEGCTVMVKNVTMVAFEPTIAHVNIEDTRENTSGTGVKVR